MTSDRQSAGEAEGVQVSTAHKEIDELADSVATIQVPQAPDATSDRINGEYVGEDVPASKISAQPDRNLTPRTTEESDSAAREAPQGESTSEVPNDIKSPDKQQAPRVAQQSSPSATPRIEVDFKYLDDGRVVELVEDPDDATKTKLAVLDSGTVYLTDAVEYRGQLLVPIGKTDGLEDISLPRGAHPYSSVSEVFYHTSNLIKVCVDLPEPYLFMTAAVVLNSWFADRLRPPAYLLVTGLPQSGKTTLLETLRLLCRRSLLVADITSAAAYQACSRFGCTLLIDENDWRADRNSRTLRKQLRAGTSRDLLAKHLGKTQHAFGTKILSALELPDDAALRSRCVHVPMNETDRADLRKPWDPLLVEAADSVRGQLLQFRLERFASVSPRLISGAEKLRPRSRDLLSSLIAPLEGDKFLQELLLVLFDGIHDRSTRDLLSPTQAAVVAALFEFVHGWPESGHVQVSFVAGLANRILGTSGERFKLNPRKTSDVLASLGFGHRERSSRGSFRCLDQETLGRIHKLKRDHGVGWLAPAALVAQMEECSLCKIESSPTSTETKG
jgi:hypothetical protein